MIHFPAADIFIGGYEKEEQQPHPFVAIDFDSLDEAESAIDRLNQFHDLGLKITPSPEGELQVKIFSESGVICEEEVWKDEMWLIFMQYIQQGENVLLGVSVDRDILQNSLTSLPLESVCIKM
ncbi:hypothetical protein [Melghirimyces algeriensis]|uniref:Uncharacterized protein n=1 Tax=Melghirimyces algeriensis TaxID=910412 RepID=A0A521CUV5_9BACL|nr:hypothetical protein [Melghirimyces algeriensis]SMO62440.1 hypothetical protein SAMN06264849_104166 [Melghirimyces algeriensis]